MQVLKEEVRSAILLAAYEEFRQSGYSEASIRRIAAAAGMTVVGFTGGSHCRPGDADRLRAAGAAIVIDDMRHLPLLTTKTANFSAITAI